MAAETSNYILRSPCRSIDKPWTIFDTMLPSDAVVFEATDPMWWQGGLLPAEERLIIGASEKRRREFSAGRNCARAALAYLELPETPILIGERRDPLFPSVVSGSITHSGDYCAAAVIPRGAVFSIGIDAEDDVPMECSIISMIMSSEEFSALQKYSHIGNTNLLAFGLKEAFYKAAFPLCQRYIGFEEVAVRLYPTHCQIELLSPNLIVELSRVNIVANFRFHEKRCYCAVTLHPE